MIGRVDYYIKDARESLKELSKSQSVVIIVAEFPDINCVLAYRGGEFQPWVVGWGYRKENNSWAQGHYFATIEDAMEYVKQERS